MRTATATFSLIILGFYLLFWGTQLLFPGGPASTFVLVLSTSVAFGGAHLGPLFIGGEVDGPFYLLQSLYMVWVGLLLGELRRVTQSWVISWVGHAGYNVAVLFVLPLDDHPSPLH